MRLLGRHIAAAAAAAAATPPAAAAACAVKVSVTDVDEMKCDKINMPEKNPRYRHGKK